MDKNKLLLIVLFTVFVKQLAWVSFVPLWQTPDEQSHFAQVQNFAELNTSSKPAPNNLSKEIWTSEKIQGTDRNPYGNNRYTYHPEFNIPYSSSIQGPSEDEITKLPSSARTTFVADEATGYPPLYYQITSWIYKVFYKGTLFDRVFIVRIFTSLTIVGIGAVSYLLGQLLFKDKTKSLVLAILVGFQPMLSFVHAGVTSDALFNLLYAVFVYLCIRLIHRGINVPDLALLLITVWLAFQTKPQANIMLFTAVPLIVVLFVLNARFLVKRFSFVWVATTGGLIVAITILAFSGIYLRLRAGASIFPETEGALARQNISLWDHLIFTMSHTYREVLPWYWGVFRWLSLGLPEILRRLTTWLTLASFLGFGIYIGKTIQRKKLNKEFWAILLCTYSALVYFAAITMFDYGFRTSHGFSFGIQGRYFFPILVPQMVIFLIGLESLFPRIWQPLANKLLAIFIILLNIIVFFWVTGSYYTLSFPTFFLQASQYKPVWLKFPTNSVILIAFLTASAWLGGVILSGRGYKFRG